MFMIYQAEAPAVMRMRCVRCAMEGQDTTATFLVSAASGHGMAACATHREVTSKVLTTYTGEQDDALRLLFALTAMECSGVPLVDPADHPASLVGLQAKAEQAARVAGPRDGDKLIAALAVYGIPAWLAEDSGVSYVLAAVDGTADEGEAHTGPKVFLYSGENADLDPADHIEPWSCALYDRTGEFAEILFTAEGGQGLDAECAYAALCLAAWLDAHADKYPRA
ncbi:hypothetical protein ACIOHS_27045 [Streptomyces sp. NPDC088253]|uniref:hypothetical protein n=1 Tax=Streptomyces sp. NPDC088253 TaxID=3365846 RepID=UPI00382F2643